jgi:hypothetical protein
MRASWTIPLCLLLASAVLAQPPDERRNLQERIAQYPRQKPAVGEAAPDFTLDDLEGKTVRLRELIGPRPIVIEFGSYT